MSDLILKKPIFTATDKKQLLVLWSLAAIMAIVYYMIPTYECPINGDLESKIAYYANKHGIKPRLFMALIQQESGFNPNAKSPKGALGLAQIMPRTAAEKCGLDEDDLLDVDNNLECGAIILSALLDEFSLREALCAYNAGENRVRKLGRCPNIAETQHYANAILAGYKK